MDVIENLREIRSLVCWHHYDVGLGGEVPPR
jgi:hypothetical protein